MDTTVAESMVKQMRPPPSLPLSARVCPPRENRRKEGSPLPRQWKLLEQLSTKKATIKELIKATGMSEKTVRRDIITLREVGFDVVETIGEYGRKYWSLLNPFNRLWTKREQYESIRESVYVLIEQAASMKDHRLTAALNVVCEWLNEKCG